MRALAPLRARLNAHQLTMRAKKHAERLEDGHVVPKAVARPPRPDLGDEQERKRRARLRRREMRRIARKRDIEDGMGGPLFRFLSLSRGGADPKKRRARKTRQASQRRNR